MQRILTIFLAFSTKTLGYFYMKSRDVKFKMERVFAKMVAFNR